MKHNSNVSRRFKRIRTALKLSCRAFDRAAGKAEGTCAIIEARDTDDITRPVAEAYAAAARVDVVWLMLGVGTEPDWQTLEGHARSIDNEPTVGAHEPVREARSVDAEGCGRLASIEG